MGVEKLNDSNTGEPIVGEIFRKEQIYSGDRLEDAPDIVFNPDEFSYMTYGNFGEGWFHLPQSRVADHHIDGILIMKGKAIKRGIQLNAVGIDITPTLLYLHDLPILQDMDGRVLKEALTDRFIREHEVLIETVEHGRSAPENEQQSEAEQKEIEQRLRDLGYL